MNVNAGSVTLIGSGELTELMVKVHRTLLARLGESPNPVFLDTPAGFELNVDEISARAVEYFKQHLDVNLEVASFKSRGLTNDHQLENALCKLRHAKYILAGPGSPSYAINNWRGTTVWDMVMKRWQNGALLVLASAAAISIGYVALPVYEIFKAGHDVCWMDGLDLFEPFGFKLAIMPHWNNSEGGTFDTRFCFMGEPRLKILEKQLGPDAAILGIDEHTFITFDPSTQSCNIGGSGQVTWRYAGRERYFPSGTTITFDQLRAATFGVLQNESPGLPATVPPLEIQMTSQYLEELARALQASGGEPDVQRELIDHAHDTMHELAQGWRESDSLAPDQTIGALIDLLISTRSRLRTAKQFALADQLRDDLAEIGILLQDTATGTTWRKVEEKRRTLTKCRFVEP